MATTRRTKEPQRATRSSPGTESVTSDPEAGARSSKPAAARGTRRAKQGAAVAPDVRRGMIAEAAYLRAERRGFTPGSEVEDWLAAEREIDALLCGGAGAQQ
jgi:hypothetical protein